MFMKILDVLSPLQCGSSDVGHSAEVISFLLKIQTSWENVKHGSALLWIFMNLLDPQDFSAFFNFFSSLWI